MEGVIEFVSKFREKTTKIILITKDNLPGNLTNKLYIKQLKLANPEMKIILLTEILTDEYKSFLFANEIFNVIEGNAVDLQKLIECIENEDKIIYKENKHNVIIKDKYKFVKKQIISIYGTSGSGKSYIATQIISALNSKKEYKICMLDMDIQNSSIDIYKNLTGAGDVLNDIVNCIDRKVDLNNEISKIVYKDCDNKNLSYITNNTSLYDCQNKLSSEYYKNIFNALTIQNDYIIIDLPNSPFIDIVRDSMEVSNKIFFVVNPNYISLRQSIKYLDLIVKIWSFPKVNIEIIVNKTQKDSLSKEQVESFLEGYKVVFYFEYDNGIEGVINGIGKNINNEENNKKILSFFELENVTFKENKAKNIFSFILEKGFKKINDSKSI